MVDTDPDAALAAFRSAQDSADASWSERDANREPMRLELTAVMRSMEGVTGLPAGPGSDRIIDLFLDFGEQNADRLAAADAARRAALDAQTKRDELAGALPEPEPDAEIPMLAGAEPSSMRAWLIGANDADVRDALLALLDRDEQLEWSYRLMRWGRADGNTAQVFAAINEIIAGRVEIPTPSGDHTPETASSDDPPVTPTDARTTPPDDADEVIAWAGNDPTRMIQAHAAELARDEPRTDVLVQLQPAVDAAAAAQVAAGGDPAPTPAADESGNAEPPAEPTKPLYTFHGTDDPTMIPADIWPTADVTEPDGTALYHYTDDDAGELPTGASDVWQPYDGPTVPVATSPSKE